MSSADVRALGLALAIGLISCTEPQAPQATQPVVAAPEIDPIPASFGALRETLARDVAPDVRRRATLRLVTMLRSASRAGDDDAGPAAIEALRALVARDAASLEDADVEDALHALLLETGRADEAFELTRHLACPTVFAWPSQRTKGAALNAHDHGEAYWRRWDTLHPQPLALALERARTRPKAPKVEATDPARTDELRYERLYAACPATGTAAAPRWMQVAEWHEERDAAAGPFRTNRAAEAYERAIAADPRAGRAVERLGEVLVRRSAHARGIRRLTAYLDGCARGELDACDLATRRRALEVAASAITFHDLEGPPDDDAWVQPSDLLDTEPSPAEIERKLRLVVPDRLEGRAIARGESGPLVRPDAPWALAMRVGAARTLADIGATVLAAEVLSRAEALYPAADELPEVLDEVARLYAHEARATREEQRLPWLLKNADARDRLTTLLAPESRWSDPRRGDAARGATLSALAADAASGRVALDVLIASKVAHAASFDAKLPVTDAEAEAIVERAKRRAASGGSAVERVEARVAELVVRARLGADAPERAWVELEAAYRALSGPRLAVAERVAELAEHRIAYENRRYVRTKGAEGVRVVAPGPLTLGAVTPRPPAVAALVSARLALAEARLEASQDAALDLVAAAKIQARYGDAAEAGALLDRAIAACPSASFFDALRARVELAKATKGAAALASLRARRGAFVRACAPSRADVPRIDAALR